MSGLEVLLLGALLLLSAAFSGAETALYALSRPRLRLRAAAGEPRALRLERLLARPASLLAALLVANNAVNYGATALVTDALTRARAPAPEWLATLAVAPAILVFGEMLPKNAARRRADSWLPPATGALAALRSALSPVVAPLLLLDRRRGEDAGALLSRERFRALLLEGVEEGLVSPLQHELARNVLRFAATPVARLMVPWDRVARVSAGAGLAEALAAAAASGRARLPVVEAVGETSGDAGAPARVIGLLDVRDLAGPPVRDGWDGGPAGPAGGGVPIRGLVRPAPFLPARERVADALRLLRRTGVPLAVVGSAESPEGVVALADLARALLEGPPEGA
ncbi:MAG: CNNM domain-containing protein [Planctomycetales bacterium]|nr:CNNM domain-containing protein [Planctomycetales bacterium]